jgi:hypothetical protein
MRAMVQVRLFCAMAAHEANRTYCKALGDLSQLPWDEIDDKLRESILDGVDGVFAGNGPRASHDSWLAQKRRDGWIFGYAKDSGSKTHPCMVEYDELPPEQRAKDTLFVAVVYAMATALGRPPGSAP